MNKLIPEDFKDLDGFKLTLEWKPSHQSWLLVTAYSNVHVAEYVEDIDKFIARLREAVAQ